MKKTSKRRKLTLNNYELNILLPVIIKGLEAKKGKANAINNKDIVKAIRNHGLKVNNRSVFMLINHIRLNDLIAGLVGSTAGYYVSNDEQEFIDYEDSLLSREKALRKVRMSIMRQRRTAFSEPAPKQPQLF